MSVIIQTFIEMDAENNLCQCVAIFQVFGFLYFGVKNLKLKNVNKHPSIYYTFYFFAIFIIINSIIFSFTILIAFDANNTQSRTRNVLNFIMENSLWVSLILIICVSFIQSYGKTASLIKFIINSIEISTILKKNFHHQNNFREIKAELFKFLSFLSLIQFSSSFGNLIYEKHNGWIISILRLILGAIPGLFIAMIAIKFYFFVNMIHYQLTQVKIVINKIFRTDGIAIVMEKKSKDNGLRYLMKTYNLIYENSQLINQFMGLTILIKVFVLVLVLTIGGYRVFLCLIGKYPSDKVGGTISAIFLANTALWVLVLISRRVEKVVSSS